MDLIITHDERRKRFETTHEGYTACVKYRIHDGKLDILHTIVPEPIEGQGIASQLVKYAYDYALENGLRPCATCPYAVRWLERNPSYVR